MGIRFQCHQCRHPMHVKEFQAGKKSRCPMCQVKFRIPEEGAEESIPIEGEEGEGLDAPTNPPSGAKPLGQHTNTSTSSRASTLVAPDPKKSEPSVEPVLRDTVSSKGPSSKDSAPRKSAIPKEQANVEGTGKDGPWFVRPPSGGQYGPANEQIVLEWIGQKRIPPESMLWREGWGEWKVAKQVFPSHFPDPVLPPAIVTPPVLVQVPPAVPAPSVAVQGSALPPANAQATFSAGSLPPSSPLESVTVPTSSAQHKAMQRLKKKKRRQLQVVLLLSFLAIVLIVVLVIVLIWNPAIQPPSGAK